MDRDKQKKFEEMMNEWADVWWAYGATLQPIHDELKKRGMLQKWPTDEPMRIPLGMAK